jgi:hypothetical protein
MSLHVDLQNIWFLLVQKALYHLFVYASGKNRFENDRSHYQASEILTDWFSQWTEIKQNITHHTRTTSVSSSLTVSSDRHPYLVVGTEPNHSICVLGFQQDEFYLIRIYTIPSVLALVILYLNGGVSGHKRV